MREQALLFGKEKSLAGIITDSSSASSDNILPAIIFLNAGFVPRFGPNRLYVKTARKLAKEGFVILRFDFSGIGDSKANDLDLPLKKRAIKETQEAMNYLKVAKGIDRFILIGICSGAFFSFKTACCDPRVVGIVPINLRGFGATEELTSNIRTRNEMRYYWNVSLFNPNSWLKVIKGKANYRNILRVIGFCIKKLFARNPKVSSEANNFVKDLRLLIERGVDVLLVYSGLDPGLDGFHVMLGGEIHELRKNGWLRVEIIRKATHTFTLLKNQEHLIKIILNWAQALVKG